jgi:MFS family permease
MRLDRLPFAARGRAGTLAAALPAAPGPGSALWANADFRRLWMVGLVAFSVRWLEMIVVAVFVYRRTGSPFDVALMTMLRMLPMALFGALIGTLAERLERRRLLIAVVLAMLGTSLAQAILAYVGRLAVWHLALASFVNGIAWAADNPVRRVMIGEVVGHERLGAAMSVDVSANNASRMLGPSIGGLLLAGVGIAGAFTCSVLFYGVALAAALRVRHTDGRPAAGGGTVLTRMAEGLALVRRDPRLTATLAITIVYNLFGWPFTSMIPVIGHDSLHLGAGGIGLLASMDGIGAFCGAILIALLARPTHYARLYVGGAALYLVMLTLFALVPSVLLAGAALLFTGLSSAGFSVMQATMIYLLAPPDMRSRMYGVLSLCIGVAPLGFLAIGLLADALGAPAATALMGALGLLALVATRRGWRRLAAI